MDALQWIRVALKHKVVSGNLLFRACVELDRDQAPSRVTISRMQNDRHEPGYEKVMLTARALTNILRENPERQENMQKALAEAGT